MMVLVIVIDEVQGVVSLGVEREVAREVQGAVQQVDRLVLGRGARLVLSGVEVRDDLVAGLGQADGLVVEGDGLDRLGPGAP